MNGANRRAGFLPVNVYTKVALSIIRLAAFGFIIFSVSLCAGDLFLYLSPRHVPLPPVLLSLKCLPLLFGLALLWKSRAVAVHLTKDLD